MPSTPQPTGWAAELPEETGIYPTHGFGSFCSATQAEGESSTIGRERRVNPALTLGEQEYVTTLLVGLDAYPAYYAHMGPANTAGPAGPDLSEPSRADAAELRRRLAAGEWVVDLRTRTAFAAGHLAGTFSFPPDGSFATYLDGEVWVHCRSGYRAIIAASILDAAGRTVVAVDDEYDNAAKDGLPVTSGENTRRAA
jgi:rhodanese-related sulfurtransferase